MIQLIKLFIEHRANLCSRNARDETCIHSVCKHSDHPADRRKLIEIIVNWRSEHSDGSFEQVSLKHVDKEGSSALHQAAVHGLIGEMKR